MGRRYRLTLLVVSLLVLLVVGLLIERNLSFLLSNFWFSSGIMMLILLSLIDQPFYSKDSNIFQNAITAAISLLLVDSNERDTIFWIFASFSLYLCLSSFMLMWVRKNALNEENTIVKILSRFNRQIGKPEVIFSSFFIWGALKQYQLNSIESNSLLWFWIAFMILNIPSFSKFVESLFGIKKANTLNMPVGKIFSVQSSNIFLVLSDSDNTQVRKFDYVKFRSTVDKANRVGLVLDIQLLNQEMWFKVLCTPELCELCEIDSVQLISNNVYKISPPSDHLYTNRFVGVITENSCIEKIRFVYYSRNEIANGQLVELMVADHKVLYQVVQGITKIEPLERKNETGLIIGEAVQLGEWDEGNKRFIQFGWVPEVNTAVFLASDIDPQEVEAGEYCIGHIPETNYPVIVSKEMLVTHHTAILGVTGSGKSVFARDLIRQIQRDAKVIIVDLSGEYRRYFENIVSVISDTNSEIAFKAIEDLSLERSKFPSQQNKTIINLAIERAKDAFETSITEFILSNNSISIFELPDITNSSDIIEYTKWFFLSLFSVAKKLTGNRRVCVVLEEAHTVVPEYNQLGVSDNASKATVNSIAQIALQGRKYNIGFLVIAQRTANVSKTVLTQCNTIIAFQEFDKTSSDFLSNYMGSEYVTSLPNLKNRMAIAMGKALKSTVPIIFQVPIIQETASATEADTTQES